MKKLLFVVLLLWFTGAYCQSGFYLPVITNGFNANIYSVDSAQFMRVENQCYVYGRFYVRNTDSIAPVMVHISTPFTLWYNVKHASTGNCFIFPQSGQTVVGYSLQSFSNGGSIQLYYTAISSGLQRVDYFFIYQTQP